MYVENKHFCISYFSFIPDIFNALFWAIIKTCVIVLDLYSFLKMLFNRIKYIIYYVCKPSNVLSLVRYIPTRS